MMTDYTIDFYQILVTSTANIPDVASGFVQMIQGGIPTSHTVDGMTRELWGLTNRTINNSLGGQFRKFRVSDLPEIGAVGEDAIELALAQNQGLIERNFFVYYRQNNLLAWHKNGHGSHPSRLAKFLTELWGTKVEINPIINRDAIQRLMNGNTVIKGIDITLPIPTNPDLFNNDNYGRDMLRIMDNSGSSSMKIHLGVDLRRDKQGHLSADIKQTLYNAFRAGATTARAYVEEEGFSHSIDLVADRLSSKQRAQTNGRYLPAASMYQLIDTARADCQEAINGYFT